MNLPETACVSVRGPKALLDLEGAHWGDDIIFDSTTGGLDADSGLKESTELLRILIKEVLVEKCGYAPREIVIFGFGQGGMVALSTARKSRLSNMKRRFYFTTLLTTYAQSPSSPPLPTTATVSLAESSASALPSPARLLRLSSPSARLPCCSARAQIARL
jgi:predicted esterase